MKGTGGTSSPDEPGNTGACKESLSFRLRCSKRERFSEKPDTEPGSELICASSLAFQVILTTWKPAIIGRCPGVEYGFAEAVPSRGGGDHNVADKPGSHGAITG